MNLLLSIVVIMFVLGTLILCLGLLLYTKRIVLWSERTFAPIVKWLAKIQGYKNDIEVTSPRWLVKSFIWGFRAAGAFGAFIALLILYAIYRQLFH